MADSYPSNALAAALWPTGTPPSPTSTENLGFGGARGYGLIDIRGAYFSKRTVALDGYRFIECRFDACVLTASTGNFELVNTVLDPRCVTAYSNSLLKALKLFLGRYEWTKKTFPAVYLPVEGDDGSITVV